MRSCTVAIFYCSISDLTFLFDSVWFCSGTPDQHKRLGKECACKFDLSYFIKPRSHLAEYFFRLFTIEIHSAIPNNLKPIGMMEMQCVTIRIFTNVFPII